MPSSSGYFAPDYFTPDFYSPLGVMSPSGEGPAMTLFRDRDAFAAILQTLNATGEFAEVAFPAPPDASHLGADRTPLAVIVPVEWHEYPDVSSTAVIRKVSYTLMVIVRAEEARDRFESIDRLSSIVQNALIGTALGGFSTASMSQMQTGRFDATSRHPESRLAITAAFGYLIDSPNDHSTLR